MTSPTDGSMPSSFDNDRDYNEKGIQKIVRRLKEEPLVPIGMGLTVFALFNAYRAMRRGDRQATNRMFRARVYAQGFTIVAIVAGGAYYGKDRQKKKELEKVKSEKEAEERRQQWIRELEIRDEEDKAFKERLAKKREKRDTKAASGKSEIESELEKTAEKKKGGGGVLGGWFGGGSKPATPAQEQEATKQAEESEEPKK